MDSSRGIATSVLDTSYHHNTSNTSSNGSPQQNSKPLPRFHHPTLPSINVNPTLSPATYPSHDAYPSYTHPSLAHYPHYSKPFTYGGPYLSQPTDFFHSPHSIPSQINPILQDTTSMTSMATPKFLEVKIANVLRLI